GARGYRRATARLVRTLYSLPCLWHRRRDRYQSAHHGPPGGATLLAGASARPHTSSARAGGRGRPSVGDDRRERGRQRAARHRLGARATRRAHGARRLGGRLIALLLSPDVSPDAATTAMRLRSTRWHGRYDPPRFSTDTDTRFRR